MTYSPVILSYILRVGGPTKEIEEYLEARKPAQITKVEMGTIWPRPRIFHLPITTENLEGLAQLVEKHAELEIAVHLLVYRDNKVLIEWYDAFSDPFYISKEISEDKIKIFSERLGIKYKEFMYNW